MAVQCVQGGPSLNLGGLSGTGGLTLAKPSVSAAGSPSGVFPLTVSADGRSLVQANGQQYTINGDAGWSMMVQLNQADVTTYLSDRASRGVNTILTSLVEHKFSDHSPVWENANGDSPFTANVSTGNPDFTTPNEAYWLHVDWIINEALRQGILILATPAYLGFQMGDEGWASVIKINGATRMTTYGTFLGNRYKNFLNMIWVMGGDSGPVFGATDLTTHVNNLANAIKAVDTNHLMTAHSAPNRSAYDDYNQSWLDINTAYSDTNTGVHAEVRTSRQQVAKPTFLIESTYGNASGANLSDLNLRTEMYQGLLGSGVGHVYGQNPMWYFGEDASASGDSFANTGGLDWHTQLSTFGGSYLTFVRRLALSRPLNTMTPDYAHTVVTAGYDSGGSEGTTYCPVMATNRILVAYTRGAALTVNKATFLSATFNVNWYNVRSGLTTSGGTASFGSGSQVFTPPDSNDWVLLLDDQALGLSNPAPVSGMAVSPRMSGTGIRGLIGSGSLAVAKPSISGTNGGVTVTWRGHEPVGYSQIANRDFKATIEDSWNVSAAGGSTANFTIATDATAPRSPNNVGQINYPSGWNDASGEPCNVFKGASNRKLYFCMAFKFSANWEGHPSRTNKILHYHVDNTGTSNRIIAVGFGGGNDPLLPTFALQGLAANFDFNAQGGGFSSADTTGWLFPNQPGQTGVELVRGSWHQWEAHIDLGTAGHADGTIDWWIDGVLVGSYTNIPLITSSNAFTETDWAPTWGGGGGNSLSAAQQQFMDAYYASSHA